MQHIALHAFGSLPWLHTCDYKSLVVAMVTEAVTGGLQTTEACRDPG